MSPFEQLVQRLSRSCELAGPPDPIATVAAWADESRMERLERDGTPLLAALWRAGEVLFEAGEDVIAAGFAVFTFEPMSGGELRRVLAGIVASLERSAAAAPEVTLARLAALGAVLDRRVRLPSELAEGRTVWVADVLIPRGYLRDGRLDRVGCNWLPCIAVPDADGATHLLHWDEPLARPLLAEPRDLAWVRMTAEAGDPAAQYALAAALIANGKGGRDDLVEGVRWLHRSAQGGHDEAQYRLARLLETGQGGLRANPEKAMRWLERAARAGHAKSQHRLGLAFLNGEHVAQDREAGLRLLRQAADAGIEPAREALAAQG